MRQARYRARARKADVTHQSGSEAARVPGRPRLVSVVPAPAPLAPCPPSCVRCGKSTAFMLTGFRIRGAYRAWPVHDRRFEDDQAHVFDPHP